MSLKKYIEGILSRDAEDVEDSRDYARMLKEDPDGEVAATEEERADFMKWLGVA